MLRPVLIKTVNEDLTESAKSIACPVLLVWGTDDTETPAWLARRYAELLGDKATLILLPHKDHHLYTGTGAHLSARRCAAGWARGPMTEFWPWVPDSHRRIHLGDWKRLLAYLRYFQQEGYEHLRFLRWVSVRPFTDPAFWVAIVSAFLFLLDPLLAVVLFTVGAIVLGIVQPDPRHSGKIALRLTWRARRVLAVSLIFALAGVRRHHAALRRQPSSRPADGRVVHVRAPAARPDPRQRGAGALRASDAARVTMRRPLPNSRACTRLSSASPGVTGRAARRPCSRTSCSFMRRRSPHREASTP